MSLRNTFTNTLYEIGVRDKSLVVLVGDISHFRLQDFAKDCPGRYYNVGICENTILSMASGLSLLGFNPVVHTISPFLIERSFEQIKLDFGYQDLGVNILTVGSAFDYAELGCTHHCYGDFALIKTIPGSHMLSPASDIEFNVLFKQVYNNKKLNVFRLPYHNHTTTFNPEDIQFGKGIHIRQGDDVTIIAVGSQLKTATLSLPLLEKQGVSPELIYLHTIKPLDSKLITESIRKTKRCIVIEEHSMYGGVFDDILRFTRNINGARYSAINIGDTFIHQYGTYDLICKKLGFTPEGIIQKIKTELM